MGRREVLEISLSVRNDKSGRFLGFGLVQPIADESLAEELRFAIWLEAAPAGKTAVDNEGPGPAAIIVPHLLLRGYEGITIAFIEAVTGQGHLATHKWVVHEIDNVILINLVKAFVFDDQCNLQNQLNSTMDQY